MYSVGVKTVVMLSCRIVPSGRNLRIYIYIYVIYKLDHGAWVCPIIRKFAGRYKRATRYRRCVQQETNYLATVDTVVRVHPLFMIL